MTSWISDKFHYLVDSEKFSFPYIYGWIWMGMSFFWLGVGGCGWVWPFFSWVWVARGECDLCLAGCGWVWPFFGCVWVGVTLFLLGVGGYDLFLAGCEWVWPFFGCGWVWLSARFITALFECLDAQIESQWKKKLFHIVNSFESFTCQKHKEKGQKLANRAVMNIYFVNNKRKLSTDSVMKGKVKTFKKR